MPERSNGRDEFYVGYLQRAPAGIATWVRNVVLGLGLGVPAVMVLCAVVQNPQPSGVFEYGILRSFEGVIYESPLPMLHVAVATSDPDRPAAANFLLVGWGKAGIPAWARGHDGRKVRFRGSLVYRQDLTMVEMNDPASFALLGEPEAWEARRRIESIGTVTLRGEIVDTKCFLGVMRPANGKVHRACAVRCLAGGVPPGLWVPSGAAEGVVYVLAGADSRPLDLDPQLAGREVEARGSLELHDGLPLLRVNGLELVTEGH